MDSPVSKGPFWKMFATAVVSYLAALCIGFVVVLQGDFVLGLVITFVIVFGLLALKAPRAAAILVIALALLATVKDVRFLVDQPWRVVALAFDLAAIAAAIRAVKLATEYLHGRRRERAKLRHREAMAREYERNQPW